MLWQLSSFQISKFESCPKRIFQRHNHCTHCTVLISHHQYIIIALSRIMYNTKYIYIQSISFFFINNIYKRSHGCNLILLTKKNTIQSISLFGLIFYKYVDSPARTWNIEIIRNNWFKDCTNKITMRETKEMSFSFIVGIRIP